MNVLKLIKQGLFYPYYFIQGRLLVNNQNQEELKPGHGTVREIDGEKVAVYKNENGNLIKLSPVCTHLGCIVGWNSEEKTWDCPCHGSRFKPEGELIQGPANKKLAEK